MTTNSAGLSGAKPTTMFTIPRSMSFCVVVSLSHLTKYASRGVVPWNAPWRKRRVHERADVEPDLRPQRLVVRLEHDPLRAAVQALLEEEREPPDRDVLPLGRERSAPRERARAPDDRAEDREASAGS